MPGGFLSFATGFSQRGLEVFRDSGRIEIYRASLRFMNHPKATSAHQSAEKAQWERS